jgi:sugar/nucleoside kinase (ribokinase family)
VPSASLHIFGRIDESLIDHVQRAAPDALTAWCAGASSALDDCDLACVNTAEARTILGRDDGTPRELAMALVARAKREGAVRVVTGRGDAPTAGATRGDVFESAPAPIPREEIRTFKGVGDVFAAHFFVEVALGKLDIQHALGAAQAAAGRFMQR